MGPTAYIPGIDCSGRAQPFALLQHTPVPGETEDVSAMVLAAARFQRQSLGQPLSLDPYDWLTDQFSQEVHILVLPNISRL